MFDKLWQRSISRPTFEEGFASSPILVGRLLVCQRPRLHPHVAF